MRTVLVFLFVSLSGLYPLLGMSHGENDAPKPRLWTCKYGEFDLPENMIFPGGSKEKLQTISLLFHFIDFGERRILVDVGCDKFFFLGRTAEHFIRPDELLRKNGIAPETITLKTAVGRTDFEQSRVNIGFHRDPRRTYLVQNAISDWNHGTH